MNAIAPGPYRFTTIAHASHSFLGPVSETSVERLLARVSARGGSGAATRVLDVGAGKGEFLVRALERLGGGGIGIEPNPAFAADARARIASRLPPGCARVLEATLADAPLAREPFTLGICTGSLHAFGDWRAALAGMRDLVAPGGLALMGPGYWQQPPHRDYLAALGGREDEQHSLLKTLSIAREAGWQVEACLESTTREWDEYERAYAANVLAWCDAHPDDADARPFLERIERWASAYEKWGRETMGYALVLARRAD